jgi:hypothetical protein
MCLPVCSNLLLKRSDRRATLAMSSAASVSGSRKSSASKKEAEKAKPKRGAKCLRCNVKIALDRFFCMLPLFRNTRMFKYVSVKFEPLNGYSISQVGFRSVRMMVYYGHVGSVTVRSLCLTAFRNYCFQV